jgi:hypothetical protein
VDKCKSLVSAQRCRLVLVKPRAADLELVGKWLTEGLKAPIESTLPVRDVKAGIERLLDGELLGRIVIDVGAGF